MSLTDSVAGMNLIFVDVEATTATPTTGVMTQFGAVHYHSRATFHGLLYGSEPSASNPAKPVLTAGKYSARMVMRDFDNWLARLDGRPIFVSDNNGYDFMWIACAYDRLGNPNPFGHSSRRISDFYAGLCGDFSNTQKWKRWRVTPHSHHPVEDAMGNVEAFARMLQEFDHE